MLRRKFFALTSVVLGQNAAFASSPRTIPSKSFRAIEFMHADHHYLVNVDTGEVRVWTTPASQPLPPVRSEPARLFFFVDATKEQEQRSWLRTTAFEAKVRRHNILVNVFRSSSDMIELLGYKEFVSSCQLPCFVLFDKHDKVLLKRSAVSPNDLVAMLEAFD